MASSGHLITVKNLLDDGKAVADTRVSTRDECEQVAEDTRDRFSGFGNGLPAFWPAKAASMDTNAAQRTSG